jgi:hypothetical protein
MMHRKLSCWLLPWFVFAVSVCAFGQKPPAELAKVTAEAYPGADAVIVRDETRVEVEESGLSHVTKTQLVKVLTDAGAAKYVAIRTDYDPASSFAEVKSATVYRRGGEVEQVAVSSVLDLPQPQEMIYWGPRMKLTPIPKLEPGDAVELTTVSKGFVIAYLNGDSGNDDEKYIPPMRGHYYDVVLFQADLPIVHKVYTITLPKDKPVNARVFNGELGSSASFSDKGLTYSWWKDDVPAIKREPRMVEDTDAMPKLVLATVPDWPAKSRWFYKVNEDSKAFAWNDAIKQKVDEITAGLKDDDEKRAALLGWVARQIRYSGISMGKGEGYTLHPGIMTFEDRCGVCKDIAGMLITMFRAAGYTTYPAMTMAGARVENLPADQFNHCVVACEIKPGEYKLYDPTWCPFSSETWSSAEKPQNYDIGSPKGEELMETPPAPPEDNFVKVVSKATLSLAGDLEGTFVITGGHYSETALRWGVVNNDANAVRPMFEQWLGRLSPRAVLTSYKTTDPVDVKTPFVITLAYRVPAYAMAAKDALYFKLPVAQNIVSNRRITDFAAAATSKKPRYDIFLRASRKLIFEETLSLPQGYTLKSAPEPRATDGESAGFSASVAFKGGAVVSNETLTVKKKIVPASEQPSLAAAWEAMNAFGDGLAVAGK